MTGQHILFVDQSYSTCRNFIHPEVCTGLRDFGPAGLKVRPVAGPAKTGPARPRPMEVEAGGRAGLRLANFTAENRHFCVWTWYYRHRVVEIVLWYYLSVLVPLDKGQIHSLELRLGLLL